MKDEEKEDFDVLIIGGGAAGISAALWCDELGLTAQILEADKELGGQLLWTYNEIKNYLGVEAKSGRDLRDKFVKQAKKRNFAVRLNSKVREIDFKNLSIKLETNETFAARAIIIASGIKRRKLNVEGEEKFQNKGIIESGTRDRNSAKNKTVVIIGGGDAAFENALITAEKAVKVFLVSRGKTFRARGEFVEKVLGNSKIEVLTETVVTKFIGKNRIEAVELKNLSANKTELLTADVVLIRIGVAPDTHIFRGKIDLDKQGYIKINSRCETSAHRIFAVGDVANPVSPTVSSAVGMGATAAKAIFERLTQDS